MVDGEAVRLSDEDYAFCKLVFLDDVRRRDNDIGVTRRQQPTHLHMRIGYTIFPPETNFTDLRERPGHTTFAAKMPRGSSFHKISVTTESSEQGCEPEILTRWVCYARPVLWSFHFIDCETCSRSLPIIYYKVVIVCLTV